jgi:16S rRNA (guanine(966)-N(2))-methyltransferase RsmD
MASKKLNTVRINAGEWRSRLIKFPDAVGLRPTPERVRQTVFNWLGQELTGQTCLDLFAGTGVMGFEALSRGASLVTLVEKSMLAYKALLDNKQLLKAENAQTFHQDAMLFLASNQQKFNLIFLDPPYHQQWLPKVLPLLNSHLTDDGIVYAEAEYAIDDNAVFASGWRVVNQSKAGNVFYHLLKSTNNDN